MYSIGTARRSLIEPVYERSGPICMGKEQTENDSGYVSMRHAQVGYQDKSAYRR